MSELPPSYTDCGCTTSQADRQVGSSIAITEGVSSRITTEPLQVVASSGMDLFVRIGNAFIQGDATAWQGMYHVSNDANVTITIPTADAVNDRIDLVVARVYDSTFSGVDCEFRIEVVEGTPLPSPVAPAVPDTALVLAQVSVPAGDTVIGGAQITDMRQFWNSEAAMPSTISMWGGGATVPKGWLLCDGSAVSRTRWARLFAAIGTTYGPGDGSTTFDLPDFASAFPRGNTPGSTGGAATHSHGLSDDGQAKITISGLGPPNTFINRQTSSAWTANIQASYAANGVASVTAVGSGAGLTGDTDDESSLPPYVGVRFMIRT